MDAAPLQGQLATAMIISSGEDVKCLLSAIVFACLDLGGSAKETRYFFVENMDLCHFGPVCGLEILVMGRILLFYLACCSLLVRKLLLAYVFDLKELVSLHHVWIIFYMKL